MALARGGACARHDLYLQSELAAQAGNWGLLAHDLSLAVVGLPSAGRGKSALPAPRRAAARRS